MFPFVRQCCPVSWDDSRFHIGKHQSAPCCAQFLVDENGQRRGRGAISTPLTGDTPPSHRKPPWSARASRGSRTPGNSTCFPQTIREGSSRKRGIYLSHRASRRLVPQFCCEGAGFEVELVTPSTIDRAQGVLHFLPARRSVLRRTRRKASP